MTERLLAALTDNGKWLEGFTRLGYESTFREYCDRFTPDYLAAVREAGSPGFLLWRTACWTPWRPSGSRPASGTVQQPGARPSRWW
ncbi:MAG: hypothetical protein ACLU38_11320 [Dysosmobacter sp.]